jgi:hypothetical protein
MAPSLSLARPSRGGAQHVHTTYDSFGAVVAEYSFFPRTQVLYVRWYGHMTSDELVRAAQVGLRLNQQWQPRGLFHDTRESSGEWGEASSWLEYEWIPGIKAQCPNLQGIAFLLNANMPVPYSNAQLLVQFNQQFEFKVFYSLMGAWRWLDQCMQQAA